MILTLESASLSPLWLCDPHRRAAKAGCIVGWQDLGRAAGEAHRALVFAQLEAGDLVAVDLVGGDGPLGNKEARAEIPMIKVAALNMACRVIDWAIQVFGGAGITGDYGLACGASS